VTVVAAAEFKEVAVTTKAVMTAATMAAIVVAAATVTATAVGSQDIGGNSNGGKRRQQSTIISSKDTVAVGTAMETAHAGAAMTAAGTPTTAPGVSADGIPLPLPGKVVGAGSDGYVWGCVCWLCVCLS
jgi:hypothetical protein